MWGNVGVCGKALIHLLVLASIGICIALLVLTPEKHNAEWVFTHFTDGSGWGSKGFSFLLGYLHLILRRVDGCQIEY
jgi:hypothetical protein